MRTRRTSRSKQWLSSMHDISLGRKAGVVFLLIFLLAAFNIIIVHQTLAHSDTVAATVNMAGKMRMLSQRTAYNGMAAVHDQHAARQFLQQDIDDFDQAYHALATGSQAFDMTVHPLSGDAARALAGLGATWQHYRNNALAHSLQGASGDSTARIFQAIASQSRATLQASESLLEVLVQEEAAYRESHLRTLYMVFSLDLVLLLLASLAVRRFVLKPLRMLSDYCQELIRGNYAARVEYPPKDEIGLLARGLNDSATRTYELMKRIQTEHDNLLRIEALFQGVADNAAVGVIVVLDDMSLRYANTVYIRMLGLEASTPIYDSRIDDAFVARDSHRIRSLLDGYLSGRMTTDRGHAFQLRTADGKGLPVEMFCSAMQLGNARAVVAMLLDISERHEAEAAAREASLVFESTSEAIVVTDKQGRVININPAFSVITGYSREDIIGANMRTLSSGRQDLAFYKNLWGSLQVHGRWQGVLWNKRKNGQDYAQHLTVNAVYDIDGSVRCFVGIFNDVTQQKHSEDLIWRQAHYDSLTGLPNRQYFHLKLQEALERAQDPAQGSLALVFLDLDLFKEVNDTLGHDIGDLLLREVAVRVREAMRDGDVVARLGGDEFTLILEGLNDLAVIDPILSGVLRALTRPYFLGGQEVTISASIGVTFSPEDGYKAADLMRNADLAMYAAKEGGRNQYRRFLPAMRQTPSSRQASTHTRTG